MTVVLCCSYSKPVCFPLMFWFFFPPLRDHHRSHIVWMDSFLGSVAASSSDGSSRYSIGFWHADLEEAHSARLWLAQNGTALVSTNTDEAAGLDR